MITKQEIEIAELNLAEMKKQFEKQTFELEGGNYLVCTGGDVAGHINNDLDVYYKKAGVKYPTRESAEIRAKEVRISNQIARMAYQIGGEYEYKEGEYNYYLGYDIEDNRYFRSRSINAKMPQVTYSTNETIEKMCEILNSKQFILGS